MLLLLQVSIASSIAASDAWPAAAVRTCWSSRLVNERTTSFASGYAPRMEPSEQEVHSSPLTQRTGVRGFVSIAWAIVGTNDGPRPSAGAVSERDSMKVRRVAVLPAHDLVESFHPAHGVPP
jgi:hypothetical protein